MFNFNLFKTARLVMFARDPASEALPTPEPYVKVESLPEAWATLQAAFAEAEKRLKKIVDTYGGERKIPQELKAEYEPYKQEKADTQEEIRKIEQSKDFKEKTATDAIDATQQIVDNTLSELDDAFKKYLQAEQLDRFNPMSGNIKRAFAESQEVRHVTGRVRPAYISAPRTSSVESEERKKTVSKESPEYWEALYRDIASKIINKAKSADEKPLTVEEKTAVMFMKGGETKNVVLDGVTYKLERDIPGKFLRLRNYWLENGKDEEEKAKEDPYIASSGARDATPVWKTVTAADLEARKKKNTEAENIRKRETEERNFESMKSDIRNEIMNLFNTATPAGTMSVIRTTESRSPVEGTDYTRVERLTVELTKKYDGSVHARFLKEAVNIDPEGMENQPKMIKDETKVFTAAQNDVCAEEVGKNLNPDVDYMTYEATPAQTEAERKKYINERLNRMASNLVGSTIFAGEETIVHDDRTGMQWVQRVNRTFLKWAGLIQRFIDREKVSEWEQDPHRGFLGRHIKIKDGKITVLQENPKYANYRSLIERGKKPKETQEPYLALLPDIRLREDQLPPDDLEEERNV